MSKRLGWMKGTLAAPSTEGELVFTASAEGINRYGFSLNKKRWKIDNFNANPVILWMHMDGMPPIGRGRASIDGSGLRTGVTFDRSDPFAMQIENKYRGGFLNAVSVGFDFVNEDGSPIEAWWRMTPEQITNEAFYDLAEVSAVPVPADPQALIRQRHALAFDFDFNEPDYEELSRTPIIIPPMLPGNSDLERRLSELETRLTEFLNRPLSEPLTEDDFTPEVAMSLLETLKL